MKKDEALLEQMIKEALKEQALLAAISILDKVKSFLKRVG
jgi:hypothetical protein